MVNMIEQVKKYNARRLIDWRQAVNAWTPERGAYPYVGQYCYLTPSGILRAKGWIVSNGQSSRLFKNKKEAKIFNDNQLTMPV